MIYDLSLIAVSFILFIRTILIRNRTKLIIKNNAVKVNEQLDEAKRAYHYANECKIQATKGIEVLIISLHDQKVTISALIADLKFQRTKVEEDSYEYDDISNAIHVNSKLLSNIELQLKELESWYFISYGTHYILNSGSYLYNDVHRDYCKN